MRLGLIARCDQSGLATQTWEYARHLNPHRTLVIDVGHLHNQGLHCNKKSHPERFPGATFVKGWVPDRQTLKGFLSDIDVLLSAECFYSPEVPQLAHRYKVKTVLVPNWEFYDRRVPADLLAVPSMWNYDQYPGRKCFLPVPVASDRFTSEGKADVCTHFLHIAGRPAHADRNGTADLLRALQYVTARITVSIKSQQPGYVSALVAERNIRTPQNVTLVVDSGDVEHYWDNYAEGDVLVMPRRFGGLCLPVSEALGAGLPVVMPDISPNNTWLPPEWLVPAVKQGSFVAKQRVDYYQTDPQVLAAQIDRFATDQGFFVKAQKQARELAQGLSWDKMRPQYLRVFGELVGEQGEAA